MCRPRKEGTQLVAEYVSIGNLCRLLQNVNKNDPFFKMASFFKERVFFINRDSFG